MHLTGKTGDGEAKAATSVPADAVTVCESSSCSGSCPPLSPCLALLQARGRHRHFAPYNLPLGFRRSVFLPAELPIPQLCSGGGQEQQNGASPHLLGQNCRLSEASAGTFQFLSKGFVFGEGQPFSLPGRWKEKGVSFLVAPGEAALCPELHEQLSSIPAPRGPGQCPALPVALRSRGKQRTWACAPWIDPAFIPCDSPGKDRPRKPRFSTTHSTGP